MCVLPTGAGGCYSMCVVWCWEVLESRGRGRMRFWREPLERPQLTEKLKSFLLQHGEQRKALAGCDVLRSLLHHLYARGAAPGPHRRSAAAAPSLRPRQRCHVTCLLLCALRSSVHRSSERRFISERALRLPRPAVRRLDQRHGGARLLLRLRGRHHDAVLPCHSRRHGQDAVPPRAQLAQGRPCYKRNHVHHRFLLHDRPPEARPAAQVPAPPPALPLDSVSSAPRI